MDFSGRHYPKDLILQTVRWYLRYSLSYRDMEEILEERGVEIYHTTPYRWVQEYAPQLEAEHRKPRKVCGTSWRMDETLVSVPLLVTSWLVSASQWVMHNVSAHETMQGFYYPGVAGAFFSGEWIEKLYHLLWLTE